MYCVYAISVICSEIFYAVIKIAALSLAMWVIYQMKRSVDSWNRKKGLMYKFVDIGQLA